MHPDEGHKTREREGLINVLDLHSGNSVFVKVFEKVFQTVSKISTAMYTTLNRKQIFNLKINCDHCLFQVDFTSRFSSEAKTLNSSYMQDSINGLNIVNRHTCRIIY
jgi:hypothetical protein